MRIVHSRAHEPYTPERAAALDAMNRSDEEIKTALESDNLNEIETLACLEELETRESMK